MGLINGFEFTNYEFTLEDRLAKIRAINEQYDLEHNAYIAFSGGKDSCVVSHLVDLALPGNKIPRVYVNTGIEYVAMVQFVKEKAKTDDRIIIINNKLNIKRTLKEKGYPFKSKEYSANLSTYRNNQKIVDNLVNELSAMSLEQINECFEEKYHKKRGIDIALKLLNYRYNKNEKKVEKSFLLTIPNILRYQFSEELYKIPFKISDKCCLEFKEKPMARWQKENNREVAITGLMREEKGRRMSTLCTAFSKRTGKLKSFAPLSVITKEWENEFVEREY